jgi:hypothetical protein
MASEGSWVNTLEASALLLPGWADRGIAVRPLRDHGL